MASNFREAILFLDKLGVYDVVLPFLLVFTTLYAILEKSKIFGTEILRLLKRSKKNSGEKFEKELSNFSDELYKLFRNLDGDLQSFLTLLETSNFLAREVKEVKNHDDEMHSM